MAGTSHRRAGEGDGHAQQRVRSRAGVGAGVGKLPPGRQPITTFHLLRLQDESGVSGTGWVAEGAVFSSGWVALYWITDTPSMNFYPSIEAVEAIHGHGGMTRVVFD